MSKFALKSGNKQSTIHFYLNSRTKKPLSTGQSSSCCHSPISEIASSLSLLGTTSRIQEDAKWDETRLHAPIRAIPSSQQVSCCLYTWMYLDQLLARDKPATTGITDDIIRCYRRRVVQRIFLLSIHDVRGWRDFDDVYFLNWMDYDYLLVDLMDFFF